MDKLYSIIEVATKLGLSDKTLRRWEEAGRFSPTRTLGNQRRYSLEDLQILDAIKHGTINEQKDLLTVDQASQLCGVSPSTIMRWEDAGKIHPLITSGNTYYPRQKLMEKMAELKKSYTEPDPEPIGIPSKPLLDDPMSQGTVLKRNPRVQLEEGSSADERTVPNGTLRLILTNILITLVLLLSYHLIFNQPSAPVSPTPSGSVQGASTTTKDPRLDDLITKFQDFVTQENLKDAKPIPVTTINLDNTSVISGTATLSKGKNQTLVSHEKITPTTPITLTFTTDYAPAKKFWVTTAQGSFTLHTDFPVSSDVPFNYDFLSAPVSTQSAVPTF